MTIKDGSKVSVHYKLTVDGQVVDSSKGKDPLDYSHGAGQMIPGFEKELGGMAKGEKKSFTVSAADGYGERSDEAIQSVPKDAFKDMEELKVGMIIGVQSTDGQDFQAIVAEIGDDAVKLDLNHPLAGRDLNFEVGVMNVE